MAANYVLDEESKVDGSDEIWAVEWSRDGSVVAEGGLDGSLRIWDPAQPAEPRRSMIAKGKGRPLGIVSLALDPTVDGPPRYALTNTLDATLSRWDLSDGTCEAKREFTAAEAWSIAVHPSAKAELVAVSGSSARVRVLRSSVENFGDQVYELESRGKFAMCCVYSPDGSLLACGTDSGQVSVFDTQTGSLVQSFLAHATTIRAVTFSPDSFLLFTGSDDKRINVFDLKQSHRSTTGDSGPPRRAVDHVGSLGGHEGWITSISCRGDGRCFASASTDGTVRIWDMHRLGPPVATLRDNAKECWAVAWRPHVRAEGAIEGIGGPGTGIGSGALVSAGSDATLRWWRGTGS